MIGLGLPARWSLLPVLLCSLALISSRSFALEISGGISAAEEGDDRYRPALSVGVSPTPLWQMRGFYFGRSYGPVDEGTALVSVARKAAFFRSPYFSAAMGLAVLNESTTITYASDQDAAQNLAESRWNAGIFTGIYATLGSKGPLFVSTAWEAAIFPAGLSGGLFLANGRKQFFSAQLGFRL